MPVETIINLVVLGVALLVVLLGGTLMFYFFSEKLKRLSAEDLSRRGNELTATNAENVDRLFKELKAKLDEYEKLVKNSQDRTNDFAKLMHSDVNRLWSFAERAQSFTDALTAGNKIQGNQGEMMLENILEQSGLKSGVAYDTQIGDAHDAGRPDLCIYDAYNHQVILVDAKMNIKDYIEAATNKEPFTKHATSVRRQIDNLAKKNYPLSIAPKREGYKNLPIVAMFCPFESVLAAALEADPTILEYAAERNIAIVTPLTLWGYLRLITWGWKRNEAEKKSEEIQKLGGKVVSLVHAFEDDLATLGKKLTDAETIYGKIVNRLSDKGSTSISRVAKELEEYGAA